MHFEARDVVSHPAELVLETMIENMQEIVPFLENVESIDLLERQEMANGQIRIVRRWQAAATTLPALVRPFITHDLLAWIDTALWTPSEYRFAWSHSTCVALAARLYDCSGVNSFKPDASQGNGTCLHISGDLAVYPQRLPGVPSLLARRVAPQVESFIISMITPNLTGLAKGLQRYFDRRKRPARPRKSTR